MKKLPYIFLVSVLIYAGIKFFKKPKIEKPAPILPGQEITKERVRSIKRWNALNHKEPKVRQEYSKAFQKAKEKKAEIARLIEEEKRYKPLVANEQNVLDFVINVYGTSQADIELFKEAGFRKTGILKAAGLMKMKGANAQEIVDLWKNPETKGWGKILKSYDLVPLKFNRQNRINMMKYRDSKQ
jgi:hypothetical protein